MVKHKTANFFQKFIMMLKKITNKPAPANSSGQGVIKFFDKKKKFGFIIADGKDYFFNATVTSNPNFNALKDGVAVKFDTFQGKKGIQAKNVELL